MGLYSDGASRASFVHPRGIAGGARASPRPRRPGPADQWWAATMAVGVSASQPATARAESPRRGGARRPRPPSRHARRSGRGGWDWEAEQASGPPIRPSLPRRRALQGMEGNGCGRKRGRPLLRFLHLLVAALRLRLLVLGALLLAMGDRQGTWNGPAARPSWRGTRLANQPNAFCCCR